MVAPRSIRDRTRDRTRVRTRTEPLIRDSSTVSRDTPSKAMVSKVTASKAMVSKVTASRASVSKVMASKGSTNPFNSQPHGAYGQPMNGGNGGGGNTGTIVGIIVAAVVVIGLIVGGYFLLNKDDEGGSTEASGSSSSAEKSGESSEETSESSESSSESSSSESSTSKQPRERGRIGGPDDSLTKEYADAMPAKLKDMVYGCKSGTFELNRENKRRVQGMQCSGVWDTALEYKQIKLIKDSKAPDTEIKYAKDHNAEIWSDAPDNFAGYIPDTYSPIVFVFNKSKGYLMETTLHLGDEEKAKQALIELGYSEK